MKASGLVPELPLSRSAPEGSPDHDTLLMPEKLLRDWGIALVMFVLAILFLWPFWDYSSLNGDEGIILQGAARILHGEVPYRDFFTFYTPGSYYWTALRLKVFVDSLVVARAILLVYGGIFSALIYLLARRGSSRWVAALVAYLYLGTGLPHRFLVLHNWDSAFWAMLALYTAVWWLDSPHWAWALAVGTLTSFTFLSEQSRGAGLLLGLGVGFAILAWRQPRLAALRRIHLVTFSAGLLWPMVLALAYFASQQALPQMLADWFWPFRHYSAANRIPYAYVTMSYEAWESLYGSGPWLRRLFFMALTSPLFLVPALPLVALVVMAVGVRRMRRPLETGNLSLCGVLVCTCALGQVLSTLATRRPDFNHNLYDSPPLFVVLGWVLGGRLVSSALLDKVRPLLAAFLLITFTSFGVMHMVSGPLLASQRLQTRRGPVKLPCCDAVIPYLTGHAPPGAKIFVYPYQPMYYFLTDTYSPAPFDYLQLGMHPDEQMEQAIVAVEAARTRFVVYAPAFNAEVIPQVWPLTSQGALGRDLVRDFIFARYRPCALLRGIDWPNIFMVRKEFPCPSGPTSALSGAKDPAQSQGVGNPLP